ncbi:hypothetical protein [Clostridium thermobutyricum]|uniref:hypothetical protein n=1 Tax=Clostridium thermobutyricum TaxID=29372 RepID=UPI0018AAE438|nr:hypothetical protein [Clostridium thermobutyricum]
MQKFELNNSLKEIIEESIKNFLNIEKINAFYKIDNIPKIKLYIAQINIMIIFISYTYNLNSTLDDKHPILKYILWNKL